MKTISNKNIQIKSLAINFFVAIITVLYYSCDSSSDNANDVTDFNEITVNVMESEAPTTVLQFDTLRINPVISQSHELDETNLSYEWTLRTDERYINAPIDEEVVTISNERNLEYKVGLTTGDWKFVCRVTDENTGVTSVGHFFVAVQNQFTEGWLVLEESNGLGDLSIILPNGDIFNKVYSSINPSKPLEIPLRQLVVSNFPYGTDEITILSENSGVQLDYNELLNVSNLEELFWNAPSVLHPEYHVWQETSNGFIINGGKVHLQVRGGFPGDKKYGDPMAFPNDVGDNYSVAPFVATGDVYGVPYPAAIYDNQGQYFLYLSSGLSPLLKQFPPVSNGAPFDMNNVGLEMIYMETANEQNLINAVMKDESNVYYMLQVRLNATEPAQLYQLMSTAPEVVNSTTFKSSKTLQRMYYGVGDGIYLYDIPSGLIIGDKFTFPGGETITVMEIDDNDPNVMMVATWDGNEGHVYELNLSGTGEMTLGEQYDGFGQIVDMDYKD
ncbi:PKD-like family lipoprotein [Flavivirga sp. 57AJ16]|uniref:PKD-like family lipoprotein n=1 Tax=Flavivirga sp. 57AJ16 TaxID=3025307 RepID=UPI0023655EE9|nr:PKD-like family lipoprotein [Flavivirga sp. 57AJ16]MDD7888019.1 PKD-like family lipoprotein [Flavivirga sp. 57AJ16]